jgi:macrodomain Ter protein organizer (MatP/YcbG family)
MNRTTLHVQYSMFNFLCDFKVAHHFADGEAGKKLSLYIQVNTIVDYKQTLLTLLHPPTHLDAWIFKSVWNIMIKFHSPIMFSHKLNKNGSTKHYRLRY